MINGTTAESPCLLEKEVETILNSVKEETKKPGLFNFRSGGKLHEKNFGKYQKGRALKGPGSFDGGSLL